ncbi:Alpha/Beta hydrolase protein [Mycena galopus ATCC 62051]|nr:Alpha/Beta hydrolase protein [Mycena galopus ATCC 62051]
MVSDAYTEAWLTGPQSTSFYTRTYLAAPNTSKAVLVFVHGFQEHIGRYTDAHPEYAKRGINVFAFDQRGFGRTALDTAHKSVASEYGKTHGEAQLQDLQWALEHAVEAFPRLPLFLSGHSMGGGEVLNFPIRCADSGVAGALCGVVACSPIVLRATATAPVPHWKEGDAEVLFDTVPVRSDGSSLTRDPLFNQMCTTDSLSVRRASSRHRSDMIHWAQELLEENYKKWPKALPLLIVHGSGDVLTSHVAAQALHDKLDCDDKHIIIYPEAFHELVHEPEREKVLDDMISFIEQRVPQSA